MLRRLLAISCVLWCASLVVAGTWTSNNFLYKPSSGARGEAEKKTFENGLDQIDQRLGKEIWVGDPKYGSTLPAVVSAVGGNQVVLRVPAGTYNITTDLSIPANITLKPERGAILSIPATKTLTVNGSLEAGLYQVFSCIGTGKVVFGGLHINGTREVRPEWWGAKGTGSTSDAAANALAIQAAIDAFPSGGGTVLINGQYPVSSTINLKTGVNLEGIVKIQNSYYSSGISAYGGCTPTVSGSSISYFYIRDMGISTNEVAGNAIELTNCSYPRFDNVITRSDGGIGLTLSGVISGVFINVQTNYGTIGTQLNYDPVSTNTTSLNTFLNCVASHCTVADYKITAGYLNVFSQCDAENSPIGWLVDDSTSSAKIHNLVLDRCWTENDTQGLYVISCERMTINGGHWAGTFSNPKIWKFDAAAVVNIEGCPQVIFNHDSADFITAAAGSKWYLRGGWYCQDGRTYTITNSSTNFIYEIFNPHIQTTLAANSATPSVAGGYTFKTANSSPTTVSNFTGGYPGQKITVVVNDANTTFDFTSTNLKGNHGADWTPASGDHLTATFDGANWYCAIYDNTP
jgi:hypothetical protein